MQQDLAALDARYAVLRDAMVAEGKTLGKGLRLNLDAISEYSRGVALVVVAYGFTRPGSPQLLRYAVDASGKTVMTRGADGRMIPAASFEASGPPVQHYNTATAFLVDSDGYVVTNRWVTEPWVGSAELAALRARGLAIDGHLMEMRAYLPPGDRSFALFVHRKADSADVAVLRLIGKPTGTPVLRLAPDSALVRPGDQLLSIGYPATAADLLFRADTAERNDIMRRAGDNPWQLVQELGRRKMIQPLVGDGTVKTTTATGLTHTAGGVIGGSGGPLIDAHRLVVAVQRGGGSADAKAAALPGVRIAYARDILPYRVQHSGSAER
jgi:hypothetical protein